MKKTTSPYIFVRRSKIHGTGVFAKKNIPEGAKIIEYVGERITKAESDKRASIPLERNKKDSECGAVYIFTLTKRHDIDGYVPYNTARYINHSCDPNAESDIIRGKIWISALKNIKKGEEIVYNYNYDYESHEDHPCRCRTKKCIGYILNEDEWWKIKRKKTLQRKKRALKKAARSATKRRNKAKKTF